MGDDHELEQQARMRFEAGLPGQIERGRLLEHHPIVPNHHFAAASAECIGCFISGSFYATISLSQALAESISTFVALRHGESRVNDFQVRINRLKKTKLVTAEAAKAFDLVWEGRNDFHHLNPQVQTDLQQLERKALENVQNLALIERELFGFQIDAGQLIPMRPKLWDVGSGVGTISVFLRLDL